MTVIEHRQTLAKRLGDCEALLGGLREERAEAARNGGDVDGIDRAIAKARGTQVGLLRQLGTGDAEPSLLDGGRPVSKAQIEQPGGWLASVITKAALTTDDVGSTTDTGAPFIDRLRQASALLASPLITIDIVTSEITLPRMTGKVAAAVPVPELDPIPEGEPPFDSVTVKPPKFGKIATLSLEAYRDARPATLAATERELVSSIAEGFDVASFATLLATTGSLAVDATGGWTNLDPFIDATASLRTTGASPNAAYMHPLDWAIAAKMKKGTGSNESLLSGTAAPADAPRESLFGVPTYLGAGVPRHKVVIADASALAVVRRSSVEVATDETYNFSTAAVAIRVIARMQLVVAQPEALAIVSLPTS